MLQNRILKAGMKETAAISTQDIPFEPSLISLCEQNRCGNYGKCWTCPPLIGDINEQIEIIKKYKKIIVFSKVYSLEDCFDVEGMKFGRIDFGKQLLKVSEMSKQYSDDFLVLSAGGCSICETCAAIDNLPCRFPEKAMSSLEAHAIDVSALARKCKLSYNNGSNTVTFFGAVCNNL